MADNTRLSTNVGTGDLIATDDDGTAKHQWVKVEFGADGTFTPVTSTTGLPVGDAGGSLTVDNATISVVGGGVEATAQRVTLASDSTGVSLTVDGTVAVSGTVTTSNATTSVVGPGVEATAQRVTIASDSTGVLSVDDNGSTLSVDDGACSLTIDHAQ